MDTNEQKNEFDTQELKRLKDSEIRYRRLFEAAQDGILILDGETGQIRDVNPFLIAMLGYSKEEFLGKQLWEIGPFKDAIASIEAFRKLQAHDFIRYEDLPLQTIAGELIQVEFVSNVYQVDHQKIIQCNIRDITQRKLTEAALQKERDRAENYLNIVGSMIIVLDTDQKVRLINEKGCQILRYSQEEIVGTNWFDQFVPDRMREEVRAGFVQLVAGGIEIKKYYENPVLTRDGEERVIIWHNSVLRDEVGTITGILSSGEDISESKKIELALRQSNELLEAVTQGAEVIIAVLDTDFRYLFFNKLYEQEVQRLTGKTVSIGASMVELFAHLPEQQKIALEEWSHPLRGERTDRTLAFGDPGIYQRVYRILHTPLKDPEGNVIGAGEISQDVTMQVQAENVRLRGIELREFATTHPFDELLQRVIDFAEGLTSSEIGFFHMHNADHGTQKPDAWSTNTIENICKGGREGSHFPVMEDGVWSQCILQRQPVIHNDYPNLPERKGLPEGHPALIRELVVPILHGESIVGILGVGNKPVDYDEIDIKTVMELGNLAGELIFNKIIKQQIESLASFPVENPNPVMRIDQTGKLLYANNASLPLLRELDSEVGQILPQTWWDFANEALFTGREITTEIRCGEIVYSVMFLPTALADYVNVYGRDVTEQVRAIEALQMARDELETRVQERTQELELSNMRLLSEIDHGMRVEEALQSAFSYNRSLIEASLDPLVTITPDGKIGDVNQATELATGASRDELIGTDFRSYFTDQVRAREGYQRVFEQGVVRDYELEIRRKDGHITPVLYNASLYRDETGGVAGIFAAARDITQSKKAEKELQQQGALLQAMMENLPVGVWITDDKGKIFQGNPAGQRIWAGAKYVGPEMFGEYKAWWVSNGKLITPDEWAVARAVKYGETSIDEEIEIECFDGTHKIILNSAIPLFDAQEQIIGTLVVNQDISVRKQAEKELEDAKELLERVFSSVDLLITYLDKDFNFIRVNRAFAEVDRREPQFFIGKNFFDLYPSDEIEAVFRNVSQTGKDYEAYDSPLEFFQNSEKNPTYWDWSLQSVKDASGITQGLVFSLANVTERKLAEQELEKALSQEQNIRSQLVESEKFAAMGRMVASVAHELNNPLQTIQNCLYLTQQDIPVSSPIQEYLDMAFSEIKRLSILVAQLRELYRPRSALVIQSKNICRILDEAHALLGPHLLHQQVLWQQSPCASIPIVNCNEDQIKQVFINISMNAIEAMQPEGGCLSVQVTLSDDNRYVGVIFRDNGAGISPDILPVLFEPFTTTKPSGLGLGLSICYELVHRHHGMITVESQVDEGSVFTVWLPLAENQDIIKL